MILIPDEDVINAARSLIGTPFHHAGRNVGSGIDCAGFIVVTGALVGCTLTSTVNYQPIGDKNVMLSELSAQMQAADRPINTPGNVVAISARFATAHCGIVGPDGTLFHCIRNRGVCLDRLEKYDKYILQAWRYWRPI